MSAGLQELVMWPVELILRGGKPAAMAAIATGLALTVFGLWLTYGLLGPDAYWPIMLSVAMFGAGLTVAGFAALWGPQAKLDTIDTIDTIDTRVTVVHAELLATSLPFWVCGQCKIVGREFKMLGRCDQCGSVIDYMRVESEADRKLAAGLLA